MTLRAVGTPFSVLPAFLFWGPGSIRLGEYKQHEKGNKRIRMKGKEEYHKRRDQKENETENSHY